MNIVFTAVGVRATDRRSIPTMQGRITSGLHRPGRRCVHQARSNAKEGGEGGVACFACICYLTDTEHRSCFS